MTVLIVTEVLFFFPAVACQWFFDRLESARERRIEKVLKEDMRNLSRNTEMTYAERVWNRNNGGEQ